jgi:hypothetical protein
MLDFNSLYNKLTKPIRDSEIESIISKIPTSKLCPSDVEFNFKERIVVKNELITTFIPWVKNFFTGLENFKYKYIVNGNTDAVNMVLLQKKFDRVFYLNDEYSYYSHICNGLNLVSKTFSLENINEISENDIVLISLPASNDGESSQKIKIIEQLQGQNVKVFVDVAYCGLTDPFKLHFSSTKNIYFAFTFSKTLSLAYNRISILFSANEIAGVDIMNKIGYLNLAGANAAIILMNNFQPDYIYKKYKNQYSKICKRLNLSKTKCILFGHDDMGNKFCVSQEYTKDE